MPNEPRIRSPGETRGSASVPTHIPGLHPGYEFMNETRSTCPYCGVGCGVIIESQGRQITGVRGDPDHPANFGRLCTKGSTLHQTATHGITMQTRLLHPQIRRARGAAPEP